MVHTYFTITIWANPLWRIGTIAMSKIRLAVPIGVLTMILMSSSISMDAKIVAALSVQDIEAAISLASEGRPNPYPIWVPGQNRQAGVVYTPFLRVAMAAHAALQRGERLTPVQVPATLTEPLVYVAMWKFPGSSSAPALKPVAEIPSTIVLAPKGQNRNGQDPVWVSSDPARLREFDRHIDLTVVEVVAAFPVEAVRPQLEFVLIRRRATESNEEYAVYVPGEIRAPALQEWR